MKHLSTYRLLTSVLAAAGTLGWLFVSVSRVLYPYGLELVEEAMFAQALRVAEGQPVYIPPNAKFVPQVYMPLFTWIGGLLLSLTKPAFAPLRLISVLSTVATAFVISRIVSDSSRDRVLGYCCAAVFLAGYRITGGFYDLARVDALFTSLMIGGLYTAVYTRGAGRLPIAVGRASAHPERTQEDSEPDGGLRSLHAVSPGAEGK